jgi:uncharacterized delta-60 repeat protein
VLARYNPNGTLDETFGGGDGVIRTVEDLPDDWQGTYYFTRASGAALQSSGKIIVAGDQFHNKDRIMRFNSDGSLDIGFGTDGLIDIPSGSQNFIYHLAAQSNDKIVVCMTNRELINNNSVFNIFLWRFTADGAVDTTFGSSGIVEYRHESWLSGNELNLRLNDLTVLPNDELLVNHSFLNSDGSLVWLRKMTANGAPDLSFGVGGNSELLHPANFGEYTFSHSA